MKRRKKSALPTSAELAPLALAGDVDAILELFDDAGEGDADEADVLLYFWLEVASDFGKSRAARKAERALEDLLESSSLRHDDGQEVTGNVHWDLGLAYLTASDHLPRDDKRALNQLKMARERNFPWTTQGAEKLIKTTRKALDPAARLVFDKVYDGTKPEWSDEDE
jgi:hypothetical protein